MYGSKLAFRALDLVTQNTIKRRKTKSIFKNTLILQGIPPKIADEIAKEFPNPISEMFSMIKKQHLVEKISFVSL